MRKPRGLPARSRSGLRSSPGVSSEPRALAVLPGAWKSHSTRVTVIAGSQNFQQPHGALLFSAAAWRRRGAAGLLLVPTVDEDDEGGFCRPEVFLLMAKGDGAPFGHFMLRRGIQEITRDFEWESKLRMGTSSTSILKRIHVSSHEA